MPRINIEDSLYRDARFINLILKLGSAEQALGAMVMAWSSAQKYWLVNGVGIPIPEWEKSKLNNSIIECGLAEIRGEFVYIKGSENQFAWINQKSEAGKRGGEASGKAKREIIEESGYRSVTERNGAKPLTLTPTLTLKTKNNTNAQNEKTKPSNPRSLTLTDNLIDQIYQKYPRKDGKIRGYATLRKVLVSELPNLTQAVDNYNAHHQRKKTHPDYLKLFSTWANEWRDWVDPNHGSSVDYSQSTQLKRVTLE